MTKIPKNRPLLGRSAPMRRRRAQQTGYKDAAHVADNDGLPHRVLSDTGGTIFIVD
jgi:hypothetical protein